jgi:hypothetical protein
LEIEENGVYQTMIVTCPSTDEIKLIIDGKLEFLNPYGHIDGRYFGKY